MKDTKRSEDWIIAEAMLNELQVYAKEKEQKSDIQYVIYKDKNEYRIKIEKDSEGILQSFLERMDE